MVMPQTTCASSVARTLLSGSQPTTASTSVSTAQECTEASVCRSHLCAHLKWTTSQNYKRKCCCMAETSNFLSFYPFTSCKMNLSKHDTTPKRASCTETDSNKWLKLTKCLFSPKKYLIHCPNQKESCLFTVFVRATCLMSTRTPPAQGYSKETLYHLMRTESSLRLSGTPS